MDNLRVPQLISVAKSKHVTVLSQVNLNHDCGFSGRWGRQAFDMTPACQHAPT